jgi:hypothetical protein
VSLGASRYTYDGPSKQSAREKTHNQQLVPMANSAIQTAGFNELHKYTQRHYMPQLV